MSDKDDNKFNMLGFLFGEEAASFLDQDARANLGNLAQIEGLNNIQAEFEPGEAAADTTDADGKFTTAADAQDFADEDELIDDDEAPEPADEGPAAGNGYAVLGAALTGAGAGKQAEDEDYDFDEEAPPAAAAAPVAVPAKAEVPKPVALPPRPPPQPPVVVEVTEQITSANQNRIAESKGLQLPVLHSKPQGDAVLSFLSLFMPTGADLQPPAYLPRAQLSKSRTENRRAASLQQQQPRRQVVIEEVEVLKAPAEELVRRGFTLEPLPAVAVEKEEEDEGIQLEEEEEEKSQSKAAAKEKKKAASKKATTTTAKEASETKKTKPKAAKPDASVKVAAAEKQQQQKPPSSSTSSHLYPDLPDEVFDNSHQLEWEQRIIGIARDGMAQLQIVEVESDDDADIAATTTSKVVDGDTTTTAHPNNSMEIDYSNLAFAQQFQEQQPIETITELPGTWRPDDVVNPWSKNPYAPPSSQQQQVGDDNDGGSSKAAGDALTTIPLLRIPDVPLSEEFRERLAQADGGAYPGGDNGISWQDKIVWSGDGEEARKKLVSEAAWLDLNDSKLVFEQVTKKVDPALDKMVHKGAATLVPYLPKLAMNVPRGADAADAAAAALARINISKDKEYFAGPKKKGAAAVGRGSANAKFAADLSTVPLIPKHWELANWHRPRGLWWPTRIPAREVLVRKAHEGNVVIFFSLNGRQKKITNVNLYQDLVQNMWDGVVQARIEGFKDAEGKQVHLYVPGHIPRPVPLDMTLLASQSARISENKVHLVATFKDVTLLPTDLVDNPPEDANPGLLRPPWAFTKRTELSASNPGRVVLLEYLEEKPLLLGRPGMGARLVTYYRKTGETDSHHMNLREEWRESNERWKIGHIVGLGEHDESPFLGQVLPGQAQLAIESGLYTAPAASYDVKPTDFLLIRSPTGVMSLREVAGAITVGQELPMHRIPPPASRDLKDLEERRMFVYVFRHLRLEQQKLDKKAPGRKATISLKALVRCFPGRPQAMIYKFLREQCGLVLIAKGQGDDELFGIRDGMRLPSDIELRKRMLPEEACALEASYVHGAQLPIKMHDKFGNVSVDKLRLAAEMLPDDPETRSAVKTVEHAVQSAPWNLTDTFVTAFREGRAIMQLQGPADPTARGLGYSFVRDIRHKTMDPSKAMGAKPQVGGIQGTDADLRRMTADQAREKLLSFGMSEEETREMSRWDLIGLVRRLSTAAAADGMGEALKYARTHKTTMIEQQKRYTKKSQEIFEKQLTVLNNTAAEDLGNPEELEAELEAALEAELAEDDEEAGVGRKGKKGREDEDEAAAFEEMKAAGLIGPSVAGPSAAGGTGGGASGSRAAAGTTAAGTKTILPDGTVLTPGITRRVRREVMMMSADGGWVKTKELIYMGRERPFMLASLYADIGGALYQGPFGFVKRTIAHRPKLLQRLGYNAARGRGMWRGSRGRGRGRGASTGRGRGRGRSASAYAYDAVGTARATGAKVQRAKRQRKSKKQEDDFGDLTESDVSDVGYMDEDDEWDIEDEDLFGDGFEAKPKPKIQKVATAPKPKVPRKPKEPKKPKVKAPEPLPEFEFMPDAPSPPRGTSPGVGGGVKVAPTPPPRRAARAASPFVYNDAYLDDLIGPADDDEKPAARATAGAAREFRFTPDPEEVADEEYNPYQDMVVAAGDHSDDEYGGGGRRNRRNSGAVSVGAAITTRRGTVVGANAPPPPPVRQSYRAAASNKRSRSGRARGGDSDDDDDFDEYMMSDYEDDGTPPPAKKKAPPAPRGRGQGLGAVLVCILNDLKAASDQVVRQTKKGKGKNAVKPEAATYWYVFAPQVAKSSITDYNVFVPLHKELWLNKVKSKAQTNKYANVQDFLADIYQIRENAEAYNSAGCGQFAYPPAIELAHGMVSWIESEINRRQAELASAQFGVDVAPIPHQPQRNRPAPAAAAAIPDFELPVDDVPDFEVPVEEFHFDDNPAAAPIQQQVAQAPPPPPPAVDVPEFEFDASAFGGAPAAAAPIVEELLWAQCSSCQKWRTVPVAPPEDESWYCYQKPGYDCTTPLEPGATD